MSGDQNIVLEEYKICSERADRLTTLIWTWATALLSLNGAAMAFITRIATHSEETYGLVSTIGNVGVLAMWWWCLAADRWHSIIHVWYNRMHELEHGISGHGMWLNRDLDLLNKLVKKDRKEKRIVSKNDPVVTQSFNDETRWRLAAITHMSKEYSILSLRMWRWALLVGISLAWALVITFEGRSSIIGGDFCNPLADADCRVAFLFAYLLIGSVCVWASCVVWKAWSRG